MFSLADVSFVGKVARPPVLSCFSSEQYGVFARERLLSTDSWYGIYRCSTKGPIALHLDAVTLALALETGTSGQEAMSGRTSDGSRAPECTDSQYHLHTPVSMLVTGSCTHRRSLMTMRVASLHLSSLPIAQQSSRPPSAHVGRLL